MSQKGVESEKNLYESLQPSGEAAVLRLLEACGDELIIGLPSTESETNLRIFLQQYIAAIHAAVPAVAGVYGLSSVEIEKIHAAIPTTENLLAIPDGKPQHRALNVFRNSPNLATLEVDWKDLKVISRMINITSWAVLLALQNKSLEEAVEVANIVLTTNTEVAFVLPLRLLLHEKITAKAILLNTVINHFRLRGPYDYTKLSDEEFLPNLHLFLITDVASLVSLCRAFPQFKPEIIAEYLRLISVEQIALNRVPLMTILDEFSLTEWDRLCRIYVEKKQALPEFLQLYFLSWIEVNMTLLINGASKIELTYIIEHFSKLFGLYEYHEMAVFCRMALIDRTLVDSLKPLIVGKEDVLERVRENITGYATFREHEKERLKQLFGT